MDRRSSQFVQDVVITIHENLRELKERRNFAEPEEQSYIDGKLQAYNEVLSLLKESAKELDLPYDDWGL
jgi:hypothetical protein